MAHWIPCRYIKGRLYCNPLPEDGKWYEWMNEDGVTQVAEFHEYKYIDDFRPVVRRFGIEDAVLWREIQ